MEKIENPGRHVDRPTPEQTRRRLDETGGLNKTREGGRREDNSTTREKKQLVRKFENLL